MNRAAPKVALLATLLAIGASGGRAAGQVLITDFDNFFVNARYASWFTGTEVSGPTSYSITATGYGSAVRYIDTLGIVGAGMTDLELMVNLSGPPLAYGHLGPIVNLLDFDGTQYSYRWYGQALGNHTLTASVQSPHTVVTPGTTPGLDLNALDSLILELDPGGFGTTGAYTVEWQNLVLKTITPTSLITDFNNFNLAGRYGSWPSATITSGPESYRVQSSSFGGGFLVGLPSNIDGTGDTHIELDVTVAAGEKPNVIALLEDGDGTQSVYRWLELAPGNHVLGFRLGTITNTAPGEVPNAIDSANSYPGPLGTVPGLDLSNLTAMHLQIDPHGSALAYDVSFNNLRMKNVPGGFDTDEDVDGADLMVWQRGLTPQRLSGANLNEWKSNYGRTDEVPSLAAAGGAAQGVPEPAAGALAFAAAVAISASRRFRAAKMTSGAPAATVR